jgi:hypothetical protein
VARPYLFSIAAALAAVVGAAGAGAAPRSVKVADAFAGPAGPGRWTVGARQVQLTLECRQGRFRIVRLSNRTTVPPREHVGEKGAVDALAFTAPGPPERFTVQTAWEKTFPTGGPLALDGEKLSFKVAKGDRLGFAAGAHGDYTSDQIDWPIVLTYADGSVIRSADETQPDPNAQWEYCVQAPGTGFVAAMDSVELSTNTGQKIRIPSEQSGYRSPGITPHIGPSVMHPCNEYDALRIWTAPKEGVVTLTGTVSHVGQGQVDLRVLRLSDRAAGAQPAQASGEAWSVEGQSARQVNAGGRPAAQLDLTLRRGALRVRYHVLAFPGTPILRQWADVENPTATEAPLRPFAGAFGLGIAADGPVPYRATTLVGGNSQRDQGKVLEETIGAAHRLQLGSTASISRVPWIALSRAGKGGDGLFVAPDTLGAWKIAVDREAGGPMRLSVALSDLASRKLAPGKGVSLSPVTLGVFNGDLDDMARRIYDWQYTYLWDLTHDDWYGLMQFTTAWWADSKNLQEQFAGRLAYLDMDWTEYMREAGLDVLWDDAGWAAHPNIWVGNREGPDFAETNRYVAKTGMKWALWFPGDPSLGIMETKHGAWGDFQWRTDGLPLGYDLDQPFRAEVEAWLLKHPRSSWQTCSGGSTYSHTFGIQRLGDAHYDSDGPGSDITNYGFSYLETPDRAFDNLATWSGSGVRYDPWTGRRMLTMSPKWGLYIEPKDIVNLRWIADLYRYLVSVGVAGRWSYMLHPVVQGDEPHYYHQRISRDGLRSLIVVKHKPAADTLVFPKGLRADQPYVVQFATGAKEYTKSGGDLMARGIRIRGEEPGELVFLNLPRRPGSRSDGTAPAPPGRVRSRREVNVGFNGVALYWSPGADDNWVSGYEVRRGSNVLGRCHTGTFYFDRSDGYDPAADYWVRTLDGDGNASAWARAETLPDEPLAYEALGAHRTEGTRNGWKAEESADGIAYAAAKWVAPAKLPSADLGGTPNQVGGAEGYWETPGGARIGRGWQLASAKVQCVRAWTAPTAGTVRVTGRAMKEYFHNGQGGPLNVRIQHEGARIWPDWRGEARWHTVNPGDLTGAAHDLTLKVKQGDGIRFVLDKAAGSEHDLLAWMPRIAYVEEQPEAPKPDPKRVVRILCGAGKPYRDSSGNAWSADRHYQGGRPFTTRAAIAGATPGLADETLYRHGRAGSDFSYAIPAPEGLYSVRLKLAEPVYDWAFQRPMNVSINGRQVMTNVDVCQAARGPRTAYERVFRYIVPDESGRIRLRFVAGSDPAGLAPPHLLTSSPPHAGREALVQAIEILPEEKPAVRIDCGASAAFIDWAGRAWDADAGTQPGTTLLTSDKPVDQAAPTLYDQGLYRTARAGKTITVATPMPPGRYVVHLKFAEMWLAEAGKRPMHIDINGRRYWTSWDPAAAAGRVGMAMDIRADDITPDASGKITVVVVAAGAQDAILQGLEIE